MPFTRSTYNLVSVRNGVAQWVACLTRTRWMPVSREFEPQQRSPLFPWARNFTLIAKYWLVPGTDSSVIYIRKQCLCHNRTKINKYKLNIRKSDMFRFCVLVTDERFPCTQQSNTSCKHVLFFNSSCRYHFVANTFISSIVHVDIILLQTRSFLQWFM